MTRCCLEKSIENMADVKINGLKNIVLKKENKTYIMARAQDGDELKFVDSQKITDSEGWLPVRFKIIKVNAKLFRLETASDEKTLVKSGNTNKAGLSSDEDNILFFKHKINKSNDDEDKTTNYFDMNAIKFKQKVPNEEKN